VQKENTSFSYALIILLVVGVAVAVWGIYSYVPANDGGGNYANDYSFEIGKESGGCNTGIISNYLNTKIASARGPTPPGSIGLEISGMSVGMSKSEYLNEEFPVVVCADGFGDSDQNQVTFNSSGVVSFSDDLSTTTVSDSYKGYGFVTVNATGTGQLAVDVDVGEDGSAYSYGKRLKVYILAREDRLYLSGCCFQAMRIRHLKWLRDKGDITQSEYKQWLKELGTMTTGPEPKIPSADEIE
jgi:hypothetical protein